MAISFLPKHNYSVYQAHMAEKKQLLGSPEEPGFENHLCR